MRILIAGGAGYIGSVLVPKLLERGYQVDVVDLLWFGCYLPPAVTIIQKDVLQLTQDDLKRYEVVIFMAGLSNDPMAEFSPAQNFIQNASCPSYLAYIAKRAGVRRFIHGGSCSVYGYTVNQLYDETSPAVSSYPYGISKLQGEFGCLQLADDSFSVIGIRKGTVSGYSPRMRLDLVVNTMFKTALHDGVINVNNPSIWRPVLSIRDACDSYLRAVEAAPEISGIFNVASGNYTVGEIADYVAEGVKEQMGKAPRVVVKHVQDFRNYKVSWEKARNMLAFHPRDTVENIVKELAANYENFKDFDNPEYYNIRTFQTQNINSMHVRVS
jgi:nucleoside-diphosphate-sugar epimerase